MVCANRRFAFQYALLNSEIVNLPDAVFNGRRGGALPQGQPCAGCVQHANRFIRKLASCEITVGQVDSRRQAFIENADFVVLLQ